jgi:L-ascorbate metabolism protein UlaG (beta-lactamase superfamily)
VASQAFNLWPDKDVGSARAARRLATAEIIANLRFAAQPYTPWAKEAYHLMKATRTEQRLIGKLLQSVLCGPKSCLVLDPVKIQPLNPSLRVQLPGKNVYLVEMYLAAKANLLVTTDQKLIQTISELVGHLSDVRADHRDPFLASYVSYTFLSSPSGSVVPSEMMEGLRPWRCVLIWHHLLMAALFAVVLASGLNGAQIAGKMQNGKEMSGPTMNNDGAGASADIAGRRVGSGRIDPLSWRDDSLTIANLGHSTLLMNYFGTRVISDPVLFNRIGVAFGRRFTLGPRRLTSAPLTPSRLGPLNTILITHAHMDHLDLPSLASLPRSTVVIVCEGCADLIKPLGFTDVREVGWGESTEVNGLRITAFGARHWGRRLPWGKGRGFNSYILDKRGVRTLLACDSAYTRMFRELSSLNLALAAFSIGAYDPWIDHHANPEQTWQMFEDSGAQYLLPIHWGTFRLSKEPLGEPLRRLTDAAGNQRWRIVCTKIGEPWRLLDSRLQAYGQRASRADVAETPADRGATGP